DTVTLTYPRIPSRMIIDTTLMNNGALVSASAASYNGIDWDQGQSKRLAQWLDCAGRHLAELAANIRAHPDNRATMDAATLTQQVETWNRYCAAKHDPDFDAEPDTMGALHPPPYYAIPLYPGGPNTKGGLRVNAQREVLDWDDTPIPRLYA